MARDGDRPFNANPDIGRKGYRMEWEAPDERQEVVYPHPFWRDRVEQATYEAAVAGNPRRGDEGPFSYIRRISELVTNEREAGAKSMPHPRLSRRAQDLRLMLLRGQAEEVGAVTGLGKKGE